MGGIGSGATRVLIVEDHSLVRQSLVKALADEPGFEIVGQAESPEEALRLAEQVDAQIALVDLQMPGGSGLELSDLLKQRYPGMRVIVLTMHEDHASISAALAHGIDGYVLKSEQFDVLVEGLNAVAAGRRYLSAGAGARAMDLLDSRGPNTALTARELVILQSLAEGLRPVEIARQLFLSAKTVRNHLASVYLKLGVHTDAQAVSVAYRNGLVQAHATV